MTKIFISFRKAMLLSLLLLGTTLLQAQTGDAHLELFPAAVANANLTELREEKNATYTASWTMEIDQLWYGDNTAPASNRVTSAGCPADNYNSRVRGYLFIAEAGTYLFQIGSDDGAQFAINLDGADPDPAQMTVVTANNGYQGTWGNESTKDPGHILQPGVYAFCVTHQEGSGGDFVKVGVKFNGGTTYVVGTPESKLTLSQTAKAVVNASRIAVPVAIQCGKTSIFDGIKLTVTEAAMKITGISLPVGGTVTESDITSYIVYLNNSAPSLAGATPLGSVNALADGKVSLSGLTAEIPAGTTGYLLLAAQVSDVATISNTLRGNSIDLEEAITAEGLVEWSPESSLNTGLAVRIAEATDAQSKIEVASFTYPTDIDYKNFTSTYQKIGKFTLTDIGGDGKATIINSLSVELGEWKNIASIAIYDDAGLLKEVPVSGAITLAPDLAITAASGATKDFYVAVKFNLIVIDRAVISAKIADVVADAYNSQLATDGLTNATTTQTGDGNKIQVVATKLNFLTQPAATGIYGVALTTQPVIQSVDANGSVDTDVNGKVVTLSNSASAVMANNTATLTNGAAAFSGFYINHPQTVTVTAAADELTSVTSNEIALVSNVYSKDSDWDYIGGKPVGQGAKYAEVALIVYESKATAEAPITLSSFTILPGNTTEPLEIDSVTITYGATIFGTGVNNGSGKFIVDNSDGGVVINSAGDKTFKITLHVSPMATPGNKVDAILESMTVNGNVVPARLNTNNLTRTIMEVMSGEYYVDLNPAGDLFAAGGRYFNSFGEAINQLNQRGAAEPGVIIYVKDDQEFDSGWLKLYSVGSEKAPIVIQRSGDGTDMPHLKIGTGGDYYAKTFHLANCSYITFDGLFFDTYRSSGTNPIAGIVIGNDVKPSENIVIQNCKIAVNQAIIDRDACMGIRYNGFNFVANEGNNGMVLKNSKFINNEIFNCSQAIRLENIDGVEVSGNYIHDFTFQGIAVDKVANSTISGNTVSDTETEVIPNPGVSYAGENLAHACIQVTNMDQNVSVNGNFIHGIHNNTVHTSSYNVILVTGIFAGTNATTTATTNTVTNNMIWDISAPNAYQGNNGVAFYPVRGIQVTGGSADAATGNIGVYNNTVYLTAQSTITKAPNQAQGALRTIAFWADGNSRPVLKNNIFINKSGSMANVGAIDVPAARLRDGSDNNVYYAENTLAEGTPGNAYVNIQGNILDLTDYQAQMSSRETQTQVSSINFMGGANALNVTNDASRDVVVGKGVSLPEVTEDIWGITRNASPTIGAWEKPPIRQLTLVSATSDPAGPNVDEGAVITITANTPAEGKEFDRWDSPNAQLADPTKTPTTFKVPGNNLTITALYKDIIYAIGITGGGYASPIEAIFTQQVTLTAPDLTGKTFNHWGGADSLLLGGAPVVTTTASFTMPSHNVEFISVYDNIIYDIAITGGMCADATAIYQQQVTIAADAPAQGKAFDKWTGGDEYLTEAQRATANLTFSMPAQNIALTATYKDATYYAILGGATTNKPDGAKFGESITVTADTPEAGWKFVHWEGDDVSLLTDVNNPTGTFNMPDHDVVLSAIFEEIVYTVTVTGGTANVESAPAGERVRITAGAAPAGKYFGKWISSDVTFDNEFAEMARFTMPDKDVTVTIEWWNIGVEDATADVVTLYPNPTESYIQVAGLAENSAYTIANAAGQIVLTGADYNGEAINVSALAAGTYFFRSGSAVKVFVKK